MTAEPPKQRVLGKVLFALFILGTGALGIASLKSYLDARSQSAVLTEEGVETSARVLSITRVDRYRNVHYYEASVSFDPDGPERVALADVSGCTENSIDPDATSLDIVYVPGDPELVRLAGCTRSADNVLPLVIGVGLLALFLYLVWTTLPFRRRSR